MAARQLRDKVAAHWVAHFVVRVKAQGEHAVQARLRHGAHPGAGQVFAQQHAQAGCRLRIFPAGRRELDARAGRGRAEQQPVAARRAPEVKQQFVARGLVDLLRPRAGERGAELFRHRAQKYSVKTHRFSFSQA